MYIVLENNGVEITNIDGMALQNFAAANRDGVIGGFLNECGLTASGNTAIMSTGTLILRGVRLRVTAPTNFVLSSPPTKDTEYQIIAQISLSDGVITPDIFIRVKTSSLVKQDILRNLEGLYQMEVGTFIQKVSGNIVDIKRTATLMYGGAADAIKTANDSVAIATSAETKADSAVQTATAAKLESEEAQDIADTAESIASGAESTAIDARNIAVGISGIAEEARNIASEARTIAVTATDTVTAQHIEMSAEIDELSQQIGEKQGTTVTLEGVAQNKFEASTLIKSGDIININGGNA